MSNLLPSQNSDRKGETIEAVAILQEPPHRVLVAIDDCALSHRAIPHAAAIADALGAELELLHVLEPARIGASSTDPVEWHLMRQASQRRIEDLAKQHAGGDRPFNVTVEEGRPSEEICRLARKLEVDLTVICTCGRRSAARNAMGATARSVIDCSPGPVLIVPAKIEERPQFKLRHILVPLDGSSRAESVLRLACRIADFHGAELVLMHAIPEPELTDIGPPEPEDEELRAALNRRNDRVAQKYLRRVRADLAGTRVKIDTLVLRNGDPRHLLKRALEQRPVDLMVLASHGRSGHADMALGSVASLLSSGAPVPVLLVRSQTRAAYKGNGTGPPHSSDSRFTARAVA